MATFKHRRNTYEVGSDDSLGAGVTGKYFYQLSGGDPVTGFKTEADARKAAKAQLNKNNWPKAVA